MLQKFADWTLDVLGVCSFGYDFNGVLGCDTEEKRATSTIITSQFNFVRKTFEYFFPLLKIIPSQEADDLKKAEDIAFGLIRKVCRCCVKLPLILFKSPLLRMGMLYPEFCVYILAKSLLHC